MGAAIPSTITCTLLSVVGNGIELATCAPAARFEPYNVSNSPGAIGAVNGAELPAFTIPVGFRNTPLELILVGSSDDAGSATLIERFGPMPLPMRMLFAPTT